MKYITRKRVKVDRVACPWLITRFIDPEAEFIFVEPDQVKAEAERLGAIPFDVGGVELGHKGELCSFVTLMHEFGLWGKDAALDEVAKIVNHADTRPDRSAYKTVEGEGLRAIAHGFAALTPDDHQKLEWEFPLYDALYASRRSQPANRPTEAVSNGD